MNIRVGEIVRMSDGTIGRVVGQDGPTNFVVNGWWRDVSILKIVTVAELFDTAGFPIPVGETGCEELLFDAGVWWVINTHYASVWQFSSTSWTLEDINWADHLSPGPDMRRLPALDAWDVLPEVIKAAVKQ